MIDLFIYFYITPHPPYRAPSPTRGEGQLMGTSAKPMKLNAMKYAL